MRRRFLVRALLVDDAGASALEYALLVGMVTLVCVLAFVGLGGSVRTFYDACAVQVAAAFGG